MRFTVRSTAQGYEAVWWVDDEQTQVFRFQMPDNTVEAWQMAVRRLSDRLKENPFLSSAAFSSCEFDYDFDSGDNRQKATLERVAYCKFLLALGRESPPFVRYDFRIFDIFRNHPSISFISHRWPYHLLFLSPDDQGILFTGVVDEPQWEYILESRYQRELSSEPLADLLSHQDILREINCQIIRQRPELALVVGKNYATLIKAILRFMDTIQQRTGPDSEADSSRIDMIRLSQKYRPALCALLVENETLSLDERQEYLEIIFAHRMPHEERDFLLTSILAHLSEDAYRNVEAVVPMQTIASLITRYYLNHYALDDAVSVWQKMLEVKKDWFLSMLLSFYRKPWRYLGFIGLLTSLSFLPASINFLWFVTLLLHSLPLVIFLLIIVFGLIMVSTRFVRKQGFSYLELFLPRLLGSIAVGLSILALESTVWEISLGMPWGNWLVAVFASYLGALAYLFLDVHKNTRLLPGDISLGKRSKKRQQTFNSVERSLRTTFRIFAIGVLEALGLTVFVSSIIPLKSIGETFQGLIQGGSMLLNWHFLTVEVFAQNLVVFRIFGSHGLTLAYFPKLVVLWAGLSLLIGAFAQLLWQDRQITAT